MRRKSCSAPPSAPPNLVFPLEYPSQSSLSCSLSTDATDDETIPSEDRVCEPLSLAIPSCSSQMLCIPERPSFQDVLANKSSPPYTLSAYTAFLSQNHCLEGLEFLIETKNYAELYERASLHHEDAGRVSARWKYIIDTYMLPLAPRELNLTSNVRDVVLATPYEGVPPPAPEVLDGAAKLMRELLDESTFLPFLNSFDFSEAKSVSSSFGQDDATLSSQSQSQPQSHSHSHSLGFSDRKFRLKSHGHHHSKHNSSSPSSTGNSPASTFIRFPLTHISRHSATSHGSGSTAAAKTGPLNTSVPTTSPSGSLDLGLTDDSVSTTSPVDVPMTPPTTPPSSDLGGSPKVHSGNTWKRMTRSLGWKKRSISALRDAHIAPFADDNHHHHQGDF